MEKPLITAVTHSTDEARVTLIGVRDEPGTAGRIFGALAEANINVDVIIQNEPTSASGAEVSFTVGRDDLVLAVDALKDLEIAEQITTDDNVGKVSVIGAGMRSHPGVAAKVFEVLGEMNVNLEMISTSPIKISCVISGDRVADAVRGLHDAFDLSEDEIHEEAPMGAEPRPTIGS